VASFDCIGNLGNDPEVSFLPSGQALVKFSVAETERIRNKETGEWSDGDTTWWRCTAFGPFGEQIAENVTKGQSVHVKGKVKIREYTKDGEKKYSTDVLVDELGLNVRRLKPKGESRPRNDQEAPF